MNLSTGSSLGSIWKRSSGPREFSPGTFDTRWTLYNLGRDTLYQSSAVQLISGGDYTLESGLEIQINGTWTDQPGTLIAGDVIRVRATSINEYFVEGVSGTLALILTIGGVACTFTLINMQNPTRYFDELTQAELDELTQAELDALAQTRPTETSYWQRVDGSDILRTDESKIEVF